MTQTEFILPGMKPISQTDADFFRTLGQRIAKARKEAGLTQQQLAESLGISQPMLASYEIGRRRLPASLLPPLAKTLKVSVADLLGEQQAEGKRGPLPKLQRQVEEVRHLPRSRQKLVTDFLDTILQSERAS
jgi:transcriptional regulator with XRE-family HTH domain